jgi:hypothetical protein
MSGLSCCFSGCHPRRQLARSYDSAMSTQPPASDAVSPLSHVYAFNEPGQPIVLHDGSVGGLAPHDVPGVVELSCVPAPSVVWRIEDRSVGGVPGDPVMLVLRRPDGDARVTGVCGSRHDGWPNGAVIGKADGSSRGSWCSKAAWPM